MPTLLATAGLAEAAFQLGLAMFVVAALGTLLGIVGLLHRVFRPRGSRWIAVVLGAASIGAAALVAWSLVAFNNHDWQGFVDHVARHPEGWVLFVGVPFLVGVAAVVMGACGRRRL